MGAGKGSPLPVSSTPAPPPAPLYLSAGGRPGSNIATPISKPVIGKPPTPGKYTPPEIRAQQQIGQIDPSAMQLSQGLGGTYNSLFDWKNNPLASSYANTLDAANAGQLPQGVMREIQQDVRGSQAAHGNDNGVAQAAQEAMTTGSAGYNYLNQARTGMANYLSGTMGQAQNYLTSGASPYGMGSQYVDRAINQQTGATNGSMVPTYNPYANQAQPFTYLNPGAGDKFAQGTQGFMSQGVGATPGSPDTSGQYIGAGVAAAGSLASATAVFAGTAAGAAAFCQVAREVYGEASDKYVKFRNWVLFKAPAWFRKLYARTAWPISQWIKDKPIAKWILGKAMEFAT
jgi:hypothetical protein